MNRPCLFRVTKGQQKPQFGSAEKMNAVTVLPVNSPSHRHLVSRHGAPSFVEAGVFLNTPV